MQSPEMALVSAAKQRIVEQVEGVHTVLDALDVAALQDTSPQPPAMLVAPLSVTIGGDAAATATVPGGPQAHDITLVVHTIVAAPDDWGDADTRNAAAPLLYAVRKALTNWTPPRWIERMQYAGGRLVSLDGACMEWADEFRGRVWFSYPEQDC